MRVNKVYVASIFVPPLKVIHRLKYNRAGEARAVVVHGFFQAALKVLP